jgi:hypothetical protein
MKDLIIVVTAGIIVTAILILSFPSKVFAQLEMPTLPTLPNLTNWNNSPANFKNSLSNYDNSPVNFNNSPLNFNNSPLNYNATNGVYDNKGSRIGYTVTTPQGVINYYDDRGNRRGYSR